MVAAVSLSSPAPIVSSKESAREAACLHCRLPLATGTTSSFCCRGCEAVHALLADAGLSRYYDLGGGEGHPVTPASTDHKWLEPIALRLAAQPAGLTDSRGLTDLREGLTDLREGVPRDSRGLTRVTLDVQGLHCSACVWLLDEIFHQAPGSAGIVVNPSVGSVELTVGHDFPLTQYVEDIEAFGYRFGPPLKANASRTRAGSDLLWRMGLCIAIAMNTMIFGFAVYCGLPEGRLLRLFHALDFGLSFVSVLVGGTVFFRSAWAALRRRILHLDLPIALGIALVFTSSTYTYLTRGGTTSYFDTLNVFIALMLVGRFLQERVLAKNRAYLLASEGADGLYTRRITGDDVTLVRCMEIAEGDTLLVGHQDLVPVECQLLGDHDSVFSLDWINGESAPRTYSPGDLVPAGAFCQDTRAATMRTVAAFDASAVVSLLRASTRREHELARSSPWWKRLTRIYVASVLVLAASGFTGWILVTHDLARTLDVVAGVLIVTCPCAFGIAVPLAYELAQARLRRVGLFVRTPGFLDRAAEIERVVFDKTGTLTTGLLVVRNPEVLEALSDEERAMAYDLAVRSSHPKSRAIVTCLEGMGARGGFDAKRDVREIAGKGLETGDWKMGAPAWACNDESETADVVLTRNGRVVAAVRTGEEARPGALEDVKSLAREGYETWVLSGDSAEATRMMAEECGIDGQRAFGARTPEGKAAWLHELVASDGKKTLFVGDGINDSLVAEEAYCAGTPAIDRPFMAARCDFYFVSPGLGPVRAALHMSKRLARVVRSNLAIAVFYNLITVTLALAGMMTPLWCAILMPVSSLTTVLATTAQLTRERVSGQRARAGEGGKASWTS